MSDINAEPTISERFCAADSDVTFESCDRVLFKVHRSNLKTHSEGFAPPDGTLSPNEAVSLSESAEVLELLFQYMYPQRNPDLKRVEFKVVADVAEAAEKYQVYAAMGFCNIYMEAAYPDHPFEVLIYATKHGYPDLMDVAERRSLEMSPTEAFGCFSPAVYIAWTRYYAQWLDVQRHAQTYGGDLDKIHWNQDPNYAICVLKTLHKLGSLTSLHNLDFVFQGIDSQTGKCEYFDACQSHFTGWRSGVEAKIAALSRFSSFL